jgi:Icc-related predicted phosphoesterase
MMRRLLVCSGVRGSLRSLVGLQKAVKLRRPDGILFAGGVLDTTRHYELQASTEWGLAGDDARFIERFFEVLGGLQVFSAVIPGPFDTPLEDFLRMGMRAEIEFPTVHLVHGTLVEQGDSAFCGVGGCLCHEQRSDFDSCSRTMAEYHLRSLWNARQPQKVLLLPGPPTGPLGGAEGKTLVGELIDSFHPSLCVVAGSSERRGIQYFARSLVINPGQLADGWAAWLDRGLKLSEQVQFLNLHDLASNIATEAVPVGN